MTGIRVNELGPGDKKRAYAAFWGEMYPHLVRAVENSFAEAHMENPTASEMKHRALVGKKLVDECRNDLKWSKQRIVAELPRLLRAKLLGTKDPRDERQREVTKDGITTTVYSVDASAAAEEPILAQSVDTVQKFEEKFSKEDNKDMADPLDDEGAVETADPEELLPDPVDPAPPA